MLRFLMRFRDDGKSGKNRLKPSARAESGILAAAFRCAPRCAAT